MREDTLIEKVNGLREALEREEKEDELEDKFYNTKPEEIEVLEGQNEFASEIEVKIKDKQIEKLNKKLRTYRANPSKQGWLGNIVRYGAVAAASVLVLLTYQSFQKNNDVGNIGDFYSAIVEEVTKPNVSRYLADSQNLINRLKDGENHSDGPVSCERVDLFMKENYHARGDQEKFMEQKVLLEQIYKKKCGEN